MNSDQRAGHRVNQMSAVEKDPEVLNDLMNWCFSRSPGRQARERRVRLFLKEFSEYIDGSVPMITVAGTSGKGTTCAMLDAMLIAGGHVTGMFMKPHLCHFRERISVNGIWIENPELELHTNSVFARLRSIVAVHGEEYRASLFEALLIIAASVFCKRGVSIAIFEAGVGGFNDATSLLPSVLSVITSIDLDHQSELGGTIEEIARDKAGIAPIGSRLVVGAGIAEMPRRIVHEISADRRVRCIDAQEDAVQVSARSINGQTCEFQYQGRCHSVLVPFAGNRQVLNFATTTAVADVLVGLGILKGIEAVSGIERAAIPGRFEHIAGTPSWLLDVAHNAASLQSLIETTSMHFCAEDLVVVLGATQAHDHRSFVRMVCDWGVSLCFCEGFTKSVAVQDLVREVPADFPVLSTFSSPSEAVSFLLTEASARNKTIVVTGSLFLVGLVRLELIRRNILHSDNGEPIA